MVDTDVSCICANSASLVMPSTICTSAVGSRFAARTSSLMSSSWHSSSSDCCFCPLCCSCCSTTRMMAWVASRVCSSFLATARYCLASSFICRSSENSAAVEPSAPALRLSSGELLPSFATATSAMPHYCLSARTLGTNPGLPPPSLSGVFATPPVMARQRAVVGCVTATCRSQQDRRESPRASLKVNPG